jgi:hypothetical protein
MQITLSVQRWSFVLAALCLLLGSALLRVALAPIRETLAARTYRKAGGRLSREGKIKISCPSSFVQSHRTRAEVGVAPGVAPATTQSCAHRTRYLAGSALSTWLLTWVAQRVQYWTESPLRRAIPNGGRKCSLPDGDQSHLDLFTRQS